MRQIWQHVLAAQAVADAAAAIEPAVGASTEARREAVARDQALRRQQDVDYAVAEAADRARNAQEARECAAALAHGHTEQPTMDEEVDPDAIQRARIAHFTGANN